MPKSDAALGLVVTRTETGDLVARLTVPGFEPLVLGHLSPLVRRLCPDLFERWVKVLDEFTRRAIDRAGGTVDEVREVRPARDN